MKKILFVLMAIAFMGVQAQAGWFSPAKTNEVAFSSNTVNATDLYTVTNSGTDCGVWYIWEKSGTLDIVIVTDGTPTSAYPKGNTLLAVSEKVVWAGTVYASRLNKRVIHSRGNSTAATVLYSAEAE